MPPVDAARGSSATGRAPALGIDVDSTTELVPARRRTRHSAALWLAVPMVSVLAVGGALTALWFWYAPEAEEEEALTTEMVEEGEGLVPTLPPELAAGCPDVGALLGAWRFSTTATWAEETRHLGRIGRYALELTRDDSPCGLQVDLRKLGNDDIVYAQPRSDRQRVEVVQAPPFTASFAGRFTLRKAGEVAADHMYEFTFVVDGDRLYGDFHAESAGGKQRFSGGVRGGRAGVLDGPPDGRLPCTALCGARCLGAGATAECRQACTSDAWAEPTCSAPDASAVITLPAKMGACGDAQPYAGRWLIVERERESQIQRSYEVELGAAGCDLTVASARERDRGDVAFGGQGRVDGSGLWRLALASGQGAHERERRVWSLVGRDPAFGESKARHANERLMTGVVAAYRRP